MQANQPELGTENQSLYQVHSRREILSILHGIQAQHQLLSMVINGGAEVIVTSILEIDESNNKIYIDRASSALVNQRVIESDDIELSSSLDRIRISFFATEANESEQDQRPAFSIAIPQVLIRLQRREYFRVNTPAIHPVTCKLMLPKETHLAQVVDISGGGIAILDEKHLLTTEVGHEYPNCHIDFGEYGTINTTLQIRNSQDFALGTGKVNRRLGCEFVGLTPSMLTQVQRYIMHLERDRNARRQD
ncbi:MAG: flagellar brake protein [Sulfuriferula sp.]